MQLRKELGNFNSFQTKPHLTLTLPVSWNPPDPDTFAELKALEDSFSYSMAESSKPGMDGYFRAILLDWILEVTTGFSFSRQTFHLAVNYVDKFVATCSVAQADFQLVGCACFVIAAKLEEVFTPRLSIVAKLTANSYTEAQIISMERRVLVGLDWRILSPTLYSWARFLMRSWDDYILSISPPVFMPFQSKDPDSFQLYIDAMSWLDLMLIEPSHSNFPRSHVAAGVIFQVITNSTLALSQVSLLEAYRCFEHFIKAALGISSFRKILKVLSLLSEYSEPKVKAAIPNTRSGQPIQFEEIFSQQNYSSSLLLKFKAK
eukprot:CAMPEP_0204916140 /NCGR_PEP_ID=MMETSP1397-20131031/14029_1 /ASSEMBLY_ACC=CAM_ASM_000891 /TAXON_ID=49980 /ORGANISM="Climacostomum Climacostomum virens, Strain Stock W-24" /LENGTH=317 /DNA_ID=CAMNT_0052088535 /DNA_START=255 /DNA_END=1205 /DNA_ORIENTATION=-